MKKLSALILTALVLGSLPTMAQQKRTSPHETISAVIDRNRVTITYGRPYSKDPRGSDIRKIWGGLVPWGQAWRMGADEATILTTQQPLSIGDTTIPAGAYTLYLVPDEGDDSKLAFSMSLGAWGIPVDQKHDHARVPAKKESTEKDVDQFTVVIEKGASGGGVIKLMWEKTQFSIPFMVKK